jgi:hypothetical protein
VCTNLDDFSLHTAARCDADEREALEQLCRQFNRPALADEWAQCNASRARMPTA